MLQNGRLKHLVDKKRRLFRKAAQVKMAAPSPERWLSAQNLVFFSRYIIKLIMNQITYFVALAYGYVVHFPSGFQKRIIYLVGSVLEFFSSLISIRLICSLVMQSLFVGRVFYFPRESVADIKQRERRRHWLPASGISGASFVPSSDLIFSTNLKIKMKSSKRALPEFLSPLLTQRSHTLSARPSEPPDYQKKISKINKKAIEGPSLRLARKSTGRIADTAKPVPCANSSSDLVAFPKVFAIQLNLFPEMELPPEMWYLVLQLLDTISVLRLSRVNRFWHAFARNNCKYLDIVTKFSEVNFDLLEKKGNGFFRSLRQGLMKELDQWWYGTPWNTHRLVEERNALQRQTVEFRVLMLLDFHNLRELRIEDCKNISEDSIAILLRANERLSSLTLERSGFTDSTMCVIGSHLQQLESLSLDGHFNITDDSLAYISLLRHLKQFTLARCDRITSDGLAYLVPCKQTLVSLTILQCYGIAMRAIHWIAKLSCLEHLDLLFNRHMMAENVIRLKCLKSLRFLRIRPSRLTPQVLEEFRKEIKTLQFLSAL